jgi:nickel/cobalt transporter (NicO) family protein
LLEVYCGSYGSICFSKQPVGTGVYLKSSPMAQLLSGTILIALMHALIPNHWLPLVAVAKAEGWKNNSLFRIALLSSLAHVIGTVLLGILLGKLSNELATQFETYVHGFGAVALILFGIYYFFSGHKHPVNGKAVTEVKNSQLRWAFLFSTMMFFSPCLEVQSLFISAGVYGMNYTLLMAGVYSVISITGIVLLVVLSFRGIKLIDTHFLEHYEKQITGSILMAVGVLTFFIH